MRDYIQADEVAALIGLDDGAAFLRRRARLEREAQFPKPMPTSLRPLLWQRARIEGWLTAQDAPASTPPPRSMPRLRLIEAAHSR